MAYQQIENYGIIGDMHTVALVGKHGSIDWFCFPHFDSPSLFAAILDDEKGGYFQIAPRLKEEDVAHKQVYWPDTNVLITRFLSADGVGEIVDFMPVREVNGNSGDNGFHQLIRQVKTVRGTMQFRMQCYPAFNYAMDGHTTKLTKNGAIFSSRSLDISLSASIPLQQDDNGVFADFTLSEGEEAIFALRKCSSDPDQHKPLNQKQAEEIFQDTVGFWRMWLAKSTYHGRWRETVNRSALVLKLLTFQPTGAIVASPTCSLPESTGGVRNWDYRYTWMRDAAFTIYALLRIGFTEEAGQFMNWLEARCREKRPDGSLQIVYGIDGRHDLTEQILPHLKGYKNSQPVRIGNGAYNQLQLDIYGEVMDGVYLYNKHGAPISYELWLHLRELTNWVAKNWQRKDEGIWEVRGGPQHFVYSKLMCWVALDRGLRLASKRSFPADRLEWLKVRDQMYEEIMEKGWNKERQAFVQHYDSNTLDAANLMMPMVFFLSPTDPRMIKTIEAIHRSSIKGGLVANGLVYRYDPDQSPDGLTGKEGTFSICTFWLVEALTRAGKRDPKRLDDARFLFEQMLSYANHLGLYAEEIGSSGEALGNFPQAFTHLALISAAFNLDRALDEKN